MNKITIQVVSDIHLEFYKKFPKIEPLAKYLFLAGDVGTISKYETTPMVEKFLLYCSDNWEKVFYVLGNHEFYQTDRDISKRLSYDELVLFYKDICKKLPNVYLLDNEEMEIIEGLNVYGTTLWTSTNIRNIGLNPCDYLNDYNAIVMKTEMNTNTLIDENFIGELSKTQLNKLKLYLETRNKNIPLIIMTHFPPVRQGSSNPMYSSQPIYISDYFSWNDIHKILNYTKNNISGWISGHTHWSYDMKKDGIRFISNQVGYKNECATGQSKYVPSKIFEIEY